MRRFTQPWDAGHFWVMLNNAWRRRDWFLENATPRQLTNLAIAGIQFATKSERVRTWPVLLKIDISPNCNLHCTFCVHAQPAAVPDGLLGKQIFRADQFMSPAQFQTVVSEVGGKTLAV